MAYEFKFPFEPPWEDLKRTVVTKTGATVYIFDTCVERDPAKRAEIDKRVGQILARAEQRKLLRGQGASA